MTIFESLKNSGKSMYLRIAYVLVAFLFAFLTITPAYAAPDFTMHASPACAAPTVVLDGNFWCGSTTITRMDITGAAVSTYDIRALTARPTLNVAGIVAGADGNIWFSGVVGSSVAFGKLDISTGVATLSYANYAPYDWQHSAPIVDELGNMWFYVRVSGGTVKRQLVRVNTLTGVSTNQYTSDSYSIYSHIARGGDGGVCWSDTYYKRLECRKVSLTGQYLGGYSHTLPGNTTDILSSAPGPDGSFWFIANSRIFKLTTSDGNFTEYALPAGTNPQRIIRGGDGALWYTSAGTTKKINRIAMDGSSNEYPTPPSVTQVSSLIIGPDNAIWFNGGGGQLGRLAVEPEFTSNSITFAPQIITDTDLWSYTAGSIVRSSNTGSALASYNIQALPGQASLTVSGIALDADRDIWFTGTSGDSARSGKIDVSTGKIAIYYGPQLIIAGQLTSKPVVDGHGGIWYHARSPYGGTGKRQLIRMDVARGTSTVAITSDTLSVYSSIAAGSDDRVWVTDTYYKRLIAKNSSGETFYPLPTGVNDTENLISGIDGNLWFTANGSAFKVTTAGVFTEYPLPSGAVPQHLTVAIDGSLWFADNGATKQISQLSASGSVSNFAVPAGVTQLQGLAIEANGTIRFSASTTNGPTINRFGY